MGGEGFEPFWFLKADFLFLLLMGGEGFEPSKASPADLQSVPFGHSGIRPNVSISLTFCYFIISLCRWQLFFYKFKNFYF